MEALKTVFSPLSVSPAFHFAFHLRFMKCDTIIDAVFHVSPPFKGVKVKREVSAT
jgi:hypothetical protein